MSRLRKAYEGDEVRVALQLAEGRRRLAGKVEQPERWLADSDGAQMATDRLIARHKARRLTRHAGPILDVCSGIGADAHELAAAQSVTCVEIDPARAAMCEHNTRRPVRQADAAEVNVPPDAIVHVDPARRDGSGRIAALRELRPEPAVVGRLVGEAAGAAVKLMPGVDADDLGEAFPEVGGELEHVSLRGRMSQAVWWTGALAEGNGSARATMIDDAGAETIAGEAGEVDATEPLGAWLYAVDPAPERAGLLGALAASLGVGVLHPRLGVLTSTRRVESRWLAGFRVHERMPWRVERVREAVASLGGGVVEVKTRGGAVDPNRAQLDLRGKGDRVLTVFVLRFGSAVEAIIAERV